MGANMMPSRTTSRMEPMIDYFMERYWGLSGDRDALWELGQMVKHGVKLSPEIVDHVATKHNIDGLRKWADERTPAPPPPKPLQPWVYFIRVADRVKIGTSVNPAQRAVALSLRVKDVMAVMEGDRRLERSLHKKFAVHRIDDTEWFIWCDEIAEFVDKCADLFTKDHRAYRPGAPALEYNGYSALARRLDNGG